MEMKKEFDCWIQTVLDKENIDDTLFYFALESDEGRLSVEDTIHMNHEKLTNVF